MKHSSNSISGIKMSSNENDAMRLNDVLFEANNLVSYMPKMEPRVQSYNMMNRAWKYQNIRGRAKYGVNLRFFSDLI